MNVCYTHASVKSSIDQGNEYAPAEAFYNLQHFEERKEGGNAFIFINLNGAI